MTTSKTKFLTHQGAAALNKNAILNYIKNYGPVSRTDIWEKMGLSRASVTQIIKQFIEQGFVIEAGTGESRGGRKPSFIEFNANAKYMLAFDWHLKSLFLTNLNSSTVSKTTLSIKARIKPDELVTILKKAIDEVKKEHKLEDMNILGIGLIMPGLIDSSSGIVVLSTELGWKDVNIRKMMEDLSGIKTVVEADGNMFALGEYFHGTAQRAKDFILMEIEEEGMGTALILNGELQKGSNNLSGEIGHIKFSEDGYICSCGEKGCLDSIIKELFKKQESNWKEEAARHIGLAVSIVINILDPKIVVLSGAIIEQGGDDLVKKIKDIAAKNTLNIEKREVRIEKSMLGREGGVKGICGLIYNMTFSEIKKV